MLLHLGPFALSLSKVVSTEYGFDPSTNSGQAKLSPNGCGLAGHYWG